MDATNHHETSPNTTVRIPRDDAEAHSVAQVATLSGWALAGYVASQVRLSDTSGRPTERTRSSSFTCKEFAAKGIRGLKSQDTVRVYVQRWQETGWPIPQPGDVVDIGGKDWPPESSVDDAVKRNTKAVARAFEDEAFGGKVAERMGPSARRKARQSLDQADRSDRVEREAQVIAGGGRIPQPGEFDHDGPLDDFVDRARAWDAFWQDLAQVHGQLEKLRYEFPPAEADRLALGQRCAALMDLMDEVRVRQ